MILPTTPGPEPLVDLAPLLGAWLRVLADVLPWLIGAALFATLRVSLQRSRPERTLEEARDRAARARLEPLLAQADSLATSAAILDFLFRATFTALLLRGIARERGDLGWTEVGLTVALAVPALLVLCDALATAVALRRGDSILGLTLPVFHGIQLPLHWLVRALEGTRRALRRIVGVESDPVAQRRIVEGLREVIEESEISRDLDETERELIGNVMEFRDVNVAAVMTPRTQVHGVEAGEGLLAAARALAECGHSRIPVFEGSLDTIIGVITARDVVQVAAEKGLSGDSLRPWLRPAYFVPETKLISELLTELRREKTKLAIVLDEYGGTAGIATLGDILREIVGDIHDEFDVPRAQPVRKRADGAAEVDASLHVSEVNEELGLDIPEGEDYETLAGFVLSELGRFPKRGESFVSGNSEYSVLEASDRRVMKVLVRSTRHDRRA